jgi:hypothetical protein
VNEHIVATIVTRDKAEALVPIEKFDDAGAFADDLRRHLRARAAVETAAAATITTAETAAVTAAETAAITPAISAAITPAISAAGATTAATAVAATAITETTTARGFRKSAAVKILSEVVALATSTLAAAAAISIKTHALINTQ